MRKSMTFLLLRQSVAIAALLVPFVASAQTAVAANAGDTGGQVQEIVVTAQRRSENLQKTPIAVTALSATALSEQSIRDTQDLMQAVPSLQVGTQSGTDGGGSATFFLRGFGQQRAGNGTQPAVGIYIDDFYYPSLEGSIFSILDFKQVEVLRGPQGTLFGRNTIGGAIRYTTAKPDQTLGGFASLTYGSYGRVDVVGAVNIPLGDTVAVRVTGGLLNTDGFVKVASGGPDAGASKTELVRVQLRAKPTTALTIDLEAQYSHFTLDGFTYTVPGPINAPGPGNTENDRGFFLRIYNNPQVGGPLGLSQANVDYALAHPYDNRYLSNCTYCQPGTGIGSPEYSRNKTYSAHGVVALDLTKDIQFKSLSGYQHIRSASNFDFDASPLPIFSNISGLDYKVFSQELQLNGKSFADKLNWVTGLFYYNEKLDNRGVNGIGNIAVGVPQAETPLLQKTRNISGYADLTYKLTDKFSILGGFRYSTDKLSGISLAPLNGNVGDPLFVQDTIKATFTSRTGRVGAQYQFTPNIMAYVSASQGFRAGGINQLQTGNLQTFKPEKSTSIEGGSRLSLFDRRLRFNPTIFYTTWKNIQINRAIPAPPPLGVLNIVDNAAKAHTYGLEIESDAVVSGGLHLFGHLATLKTKYDSVSGTGAINVNSRFERAPKFSYGFGLSYTNKISDDSKVNTTLNWSAQSSQSSTATDNDTITIPAYGVANARIEYSTSHDQLTIGLGVTNLFDKAYYVGGSDYFATSGTIHYDLGRPREFNVSAKIKL